MVAVVLVLVAPACRLLSPITVGGQGGGGSGEGAMTVTIVNDTGRPDSTVYVLLTGNDARATGLVVDQPRPLSSLPTAGAPHTYEFEVDNVEAGRIYVSFDEPLQALPAPSPDVSPIRFDWMELTYPGAGNLTAVDMFGIPMSLSTYDRHEPEQQLGERTFTCYTDVVVQGFAEAGVDVSQARRQTTSGQFARVVSPNITSGAFPGFEPYIASMGGQEIRIRGDYVGPNGPHGGFDYTGTFQVDGSIAMHGTVPGGVGETFAVAGSSLPEGIYSANGPYTKGGAPGQVGDNDVYSAIYRDLVAAFAWGYWGGDYGSDNAAFDGKPAFAHARSSQPPFSAYNTYAAVLHQYSDTYGFPFSDTYGNPKQPLIGMQGDVGRLQVTIHPDESPPGCPSVQGRP